MATTLPLVIFVLATTGLSIITLIGFVFTEWHDERGVGADSITQRAGAARGLNLRLQREDRVAHAADAQNDALKAA